MDATELLTVLAAYRASGQQLGAQRARWQAQVAILSGDAVGPPLSDAAAMALVDDHRATLHAHAAQRAHWERLRQQVLAASPEPDPAAPEQAPLPPTRSYRMATPDATPAQLPIDWDTRPEHAADRAGQARYEAQLAREIDYHVRWTTDSATSAAQARTLACDDVDMLRHIQAPAVRQQALLAMAESARAHADYAAETLRLAPELAPQLAAADLSAEQIQQQAARLNAVIGTASIVMSAPRDALGREEGAGMAADDIATLAAITEPALRTTALLAVAESRHAQPHYQRAFDQHAPALAAEVEAAVAHRFPLRLAR
jgi:hypothetical protein